ncbi:MAG: deoxynucleoside kinase [Clostridiales bacterium]|nr:deoxynucleoside kinase [Clostridiales bacterium]
MKGRLVVIEGLDGSGKSTQMDLLEDALKKRNVPYRRIKLPDYESDSSSLVKMYLGGKFGNDPDDVNAYAASSFYAVDRVANYVCKWKSDYISGKLIIADRYTTSNAYHQMQKLPREKWDEYLRWLEDYEYEKLSIPRPDAVIYLDMPVEISQKLMSGRYNGDENKKDIHEVNVDYLKSCGKAALYAAEKLGWDIVRCSDGTNPFDIKTIGHTVFDIVNEKIGGDLK